MMRNAKSTREARSMGGATGRTWGLLVFVWAGLAACQLDGDARFFRADENGALRPPWSGDWKDSSDVVRRSPNGATDAYREDTFAIAFGDGFFKYLPDTTGVNEVVILLEFTEEGRMEENESIAKVLGPFRRKADGTHSSTVGTYVYGPKVMQGDALRMRIQVIEVDSEERNDTTALLDFLGETASALADPVTKAEIALVKEIGKTLSDLNQNDILLEYEVTFVPYDQNVWERYTNADGKGNGISIPLRAGTWGIIKQENEHWTRSFFTRTAAVEWDWGWRTPASFLTAAGAVIADLIVAPVALFSRTFLDVPDRSSLRPIQLVSEPTTNGVARVHRYKDDGMELDLVRDDQRIHVANGENLIPYTSKTWLTFQIIRGGDPTTWQFRRALAPLEETVADLLKQSTVADVLNARKQAVVDAARASRSCIRATVSTRSPCCRRGRPST